MIMHIFEWVCDEPGTPSASKLARTEKNPLHIMLICMIPWVKLQYITSAEAASIRTFPCCSCIHKTASEIFLLASAIDINRELPACRRYNNCGYYVIVMVVGAHSKLHSFWWIDSSEIVTCDVIGRDRALFYFSRDANDCTRGRVASIAFCY